MLSTAAALVWPATSVQTGPEAHDSGATPRESAPVAVGGGGPGADHDADQGLGQDADPEGDAGGSGDTSPEPPPLDAPRDEAAPMPPTPPKAPSEPAAWDARYHSPREGGELLAAWAAADPLHARVLPWGLSASGVALEALEFAAGPLDTAASGAEPGSGVDGRAPRPRIYLIGALDGRSLAGAEAVLRVTGELLERLANLPPEFVFVSVPFAGHDGLVRLRLGQDSSGANGTPWDNDGDGQLDEDGPDDLDGDGRISSMLLADDSGSWVLSADERFLRPARPGEGPRYLLLPEGNDDDGDGRFNEDGAGGVRPDMNFPLGWDGPRGHPLAGELPLSAPESRALVDHILAGETAAVVLFGGEHGGLAFPGGMAAPPWPAGADGPLWERLTADFAGATGRARLSPVGQLALGGDLAQLAGAERPGAALDWIYGVAGVLAVELSPWGPRMLVAGGGRALSGSLDVGGGPGAPGADQGTAPAAEDRAWAHWLDNVRGGIGFIDWHPVNLGEGGAGRRVLVGGWEPRTRLNPPGEKLGQATEGLGEFVADLAGNLPRLAVRITGVERDGEWVRLAAHVENQGSLPTRLWPTGRWDGRPVQALAPPAPAPGGEQLRGAPANRDGAGTGERSLASAPVSLELVIPTGAELLAGQSRVLLESLPGGSSGPQAVWLLRAAPGSVFTLRASAPGCRAVEREVRP